MNNLSIFFYFCVFTVVFGQTVDRIWIQNDTLIPEGVGYSPTLGFLASSIAYGGLFQIKENGEAIHLAETASSTLGMFVYEDDSTVLICQRSGSLYQYSIDSISSVTETNVFSPADFGITSGFLNDVTYDPVLNQAFATDTGENSVFKFDLQSGNITVFSNSSLFDGPNGIVSKNGEYILVCSSGGQTLTKVNYTTEEATDVLIDYQGEVTMESLDGMVLTNGVLYITCSAGIYELNSTDNWNSATVVQVHSYPATFNRPTTNTLAANLGIYAINSNSFSDGNYSISKVATAANISQTTAAPTQGTNSSMTQATTGNVTGSQTQETTGDKTGSDTGATTSSMITVTEETTGSTMEPTSTSATGAQTSSNDSETSFGITTGFQFFSFGLLLCIILCL